MFNYPKPNITPRISLKDDFPRIGDSRRLTCLKLEILPKGQYDPQLQITVVENVSGDKIKKVIRTEAPHEGNEFLGSQAYRAFFEANIQPGDVFSIIRTGTMENKWGTAVFTVRKEGTPVSRTVDSGAGIGGAPDPIEVNNDPKEEVRLEDIPL